VAGSRLQHLSCGFPEYLAIEAKRAALLQEAAPLVCAEAKATSAKLGGGEARLTIDVVKIAVQQALAKLRQSTPGAAPGPGNPPAN